MTGSSSTQCGRLWSRGGQTRRHRGGPRRDPGRDDPVEPNRSRLYFVRPHDGRARLVNVVKRHVARLLMHPDTWERHAIVARLVGGTQEILDVGGVRGQLAAFVTRARVVTINVEPPADIVFDGRSFPFADSSFDAVVSLDVLEHLPQGQRRAHVLELARVARRRVVVCCPLGTLDHVSAERDLARWYRDTTGRSHRFLAEHLERGLPTADDLRLLAGNISENWNSFFTGISSA